MSPQLGLDGQLLDSLYAAAVDPQLWHAFLVCISDRLGANWSGLISRDAGSIPQIDANFGVPAEAIRLYNEHYSTTDPWHAAFRERGLTNWMGRASSLVTESKFVKSEFYNDYFRAERLPVFYECGAVFDDKEGNLTVLTVLRDRCRGDYDESEVSFVKEIAPHLRRALWTYHKLVDLQKHSTAAGSIVAGLDVGLIGLDGLGRVCFKNELAESLVRSRVLKVTADNKLSAEISHEAQGLARLVQSACNPSNGALPGGALALHSGDDVLHVSIFPVPSSKKGFPGRLKALATISHTSASPAPRSEILRQLFRLTPSESRVTMLLLEGLEPREIAQRTGTTENTVRFQLKTIYRKTGTSRQSQLVRLVAQLPGTTSPCFHEASAVISSRGRS
jgi:DNA-binding CsgD family transcriptional regulator